MAESITSGKKLSKKSPPDTLDAVDLLSQAEASGRIPTRSVSEGQLNSNKRHRDQERVLLDPRCQAIPTGQLREVDNH